MNKEVTTKVGNLSHFQIPCNLNLSSIILEKLGAKEGKKHLKHLPKYYYFLHLIYSLRKNNPDYTVNSYININWEQLAKVITKDKTDIIISNLFEWGIIEINEHYCAGKFSKSYRLTEMYRHGKSIMTTNNSSNIKLNFQKRVNNKTKDLLSNNNIPEYRFLRNCLLEVEIDFENALKELETAYIEKRKLKDKEIKTNKGFYITKSKRTFNDDTFNSYLSILNLVNNGESNFDICKTTNRVYSNITSLPEMLRPFLTYKKENLLYLDISSSQPYLFYSILTKEVKKRKYLKNQESLERDGYGKEERGNYCLISPDFYNEVEFFGALLSDGKLYSFLKDKLNENGIDVDVKKAKKLLFKKWFYCKPNDKTDHIKQTFRSCFPQISIYIDYLKKEDYKFLSIKLCKIESELVTRRIAKRIQEEISKPFLLTIHDGLLTIADQFDEVYNIMLEELESFVGIRPHIKIEDFTVKKKETTKAITIRPPKEKAINKAFFFFGKAA